MPPFDREAALKAAEKSLRLGRIDAAIAEYQRIVKVQPRDWNSANTLGDLYVRANKPDEGIAQYKRIAEHLAQEGFYPKAAALYKKILKIRPNDEKVMLQTGDLALQQGLLADAKNAYKTVAERRRNRGDRSGAAEVDIRLGRLDPEDLDARLRAAHAAKEIGDNATAITEFREIAVLMHAQGKAADALGVFQVAYELDPKDAEVRRRLLFGYLQGGDVARARSFAEGPAELKQIASALEQAGQNDQALEVLSEVAALQPEDFEVRASLAQAYAASGNLGRAREFLDERTAGDNATLWLTLAEIGLSEERLDEGRASVARALSLDAAIRDAVVSLGWRLAERSPEAGYRCIDAVVDRAVSSQDYAAAAAALHGFVIRVPHHLIALMRLVEVCVDGGLETTMYEAQAQLADAYLEVGRGMEARIISEDLVAHEPRNTANIERFRRALVMSGEKDPDGVIAERLSGDSPFLATDSLDLNEGVFFQDVDVATADAEEKPAVDPGVTDAPAPQSDTDAPVQAAAPNALDEVFREMQNVAERESDDKAAAELFGLGVTYQDLGMVDDAIEALQEAARSPRQRFQASVRLGRLYRERGDVARAIEWFERAAESSPSTPDVGRALLYDLAETLENAGEHGRALAVFVELEAESPGYRDVTNRIDRLSTTQAKG